jgi:hypothetical protein
MMGIIWALVVGLLGGFYAGYQVQEGNIAKKEQARLEAQMKFDKSQAELKQATANAIDDMGVAYKQGQEEGKVVEKKIYVRVNQERQGNTNVFNNPSCELPPTSYALLIANLKGVRSGAILPEVTTVTSPPPQEAVSPSDGRPPKPVPRRKAGS